MYPYRIQQKASQIQLMPQVVGHVIGEGELINSGHMDDGIEAVEEESTVEKKTRKNRGKREQDAFWRDFVFTDWRKIKGGGEELGTSSKK